MTHASALWWQPITHKSLETLTNVFKNLNDKIVAAAPTMLLGAIVFSIFFVVAWTGKRIIALTAPRVQADTGVVLLLSRVYYYGVLIFGSITALSTAGLDVNALIAGLGLTGFALGFALKDVLSNLVSGIMLLVYRPFNIGDHIVMGTYEGTIDTIRMRDTVLRSHDGRYIIIPNTKLITEVVVNNTAAKLVRESVEIQLAPDADARKAQEVFVRAMDEHPQVKGHVEPGVIIKKADNDLMQLEGRFWYDPRHMDQATIRKEITQQIKTAFDAAGLPATILLPNTLQTVTNGEPRKEDAQESEDF